MTRAMAARLVRRNHGKGHSYQLDGRKVVGVTTATGKLPKDALIDWSAKTTANYAVDHWDELAGMPLSERLSTLVRARFNVTKAAALRGTQIHALGDKVARGIEVDAGEHQSEVEAYARFLDRWDVTVHATETPCANTTHLYAGTADAWATFGRGELAGLRVLLDIKTGRGVYDDAALQLAAYRYCDLWQPEGPESEEPLPPVDAVVVAHVLPDSVRLLPVNAGPEQFRQFLYLLQTAHWLDANKEAPPIGDALLDPGVPA
jgi:hypothetical protein